MQNLNFFNQHIFGINQHNLASYGEQHIIGIFMRNYAGVFNVLKNNYVSNCD